VGLSSRGALLTSTLKWKFAIAITENSEFDSFAVKPFILADSLNSPLRSLDSKEEVLIRKRLNE